MFFEYTRMSEILKYKLSAACRHFRRDTISKTDRLRENTVNSTRRVPIPFSFVRGDRINNARNSSIVNKFHFGLPRRTSSSSSSSFFSRIRSMADAGARLIRTQQMVWIPGSFGNNKTNTAELIFFSSLITSAATFSLFYRKILIPSIILLLFIYRVMCTFG